MCLVPSDVLPLERKWLHDGMHAIVGLNAVRDWECGGGRTVGIAAWDEMGLDPDILDEEGENQEIPRKDGLLLGDIPVGLMILARGLLMITRSSGS